MSKQTEKFEVRPKTVYDIIRIFTDGSEWAEEECESEEEANEKVKALDKTQ